MVVTAGGVEKGREKQWGKVFDMKRDEMREDNKCCDSDGSREKAPCVAVASWSSSRKKMRSKTERGGGLEGSAITRPCTECGKKFWSWKALFGHMRCHPERQWRGINPPPNLRRQSLLTPEDHDVAASLLLLANGNKLVLQEQDHHPNHHFPFQFQCSCCNKVFGSHQALGGHRASHKNVKGCFAITTPLPDHEVDAAAAAAAYDNVGAGGHKCSICLRVFSTGQALGGHKRCHWEKADAALPLLLIDSSTNNKSSSSSLDLNLPPPLPADYDHSPLTLDLRLGL